MLVRGSHNIGVAMDTPRGLIVPNIKGVNARSILDIAHELARLQALAAAGKLGEEDLADTTFTCAGRGWERGWERDDCGWEGRVARAGEAEAERARAASSSSSDSSFFL
jgi:hypothetical protein